MVELAGLPGIADDQFAGRGDCPVAGDGAIDLSAGQEGCTGGNGYRQAAVRNAKWQRRPSPGLIAIPPEAEYVSAPPKANVPEPIFDSPAPPPRLPENVELRLLLLPVKRSENWQNHSTRNCRSG